MLSLSNIFFYILCTLQKAIFVIYLFLEQNTKVSLEMLSSHSTHLVGEYK